MNKLEFNQETRRFAIKSDEKWCVVQELNFTSPSTFRVMKDSTRLTKLNNKPEKLHRLGEKYWYQFEHPIAGPFNTKDEAIEAKIKCKLKYNRSLLASEKPIAKKLGLIK